MTTVRVVVVDDHRLVREGLRAMLREHPEFTLVGEAEDAASAMRVVSEQRPDIALVDLKLRDESGVDLCRRLVRDHPSTYVVALSVYEDPDWVLAALRAGARGYLLKGVSPDELASVLKSVRAGEIMLDPGLGGRLAMRYALNGSVGGGSEAKAAAPSVNGIARSSSPGENPYRLSVRERQVLARVSHGESNNQIARTLYISEETVRTHVKAILRKLQANDRSQAVAIALRSGLVD